jgi:predicted ester cyclase
VPLEANKALARRWFEEVATGHHFELIDKLVAPEFVNHAILPGGDQAAQTREGLRLIMIESARSAPDEDWVIEDQVAEGDKVVNFIRWSGTDIGGMAGRPATGRRFSTQRVHTFRVASGRIVEHWALRDDLTVGLQVGLVNLA